MQGLAQDQKNFSQWQHLLWQHVLRSDATHSPMCMQDYFNYQKPSLEAGTGGLSKELRAEILEWLKKNDK